jgi:rhodanese-related sulfurtransferase
MMRPSLNEKTVEKGTCGQFPIQPTSLKGIKMNLISREELKEKLTKKEDIKLVFVLGAWQYQAKHIPGSLHLDTVEAALSTLRPDDEIIVYCSNEFCPASVSVYNFLVDAGFKNVRRYAGGILDWERAGYPLEGDMVAG